MNRDADLADRAGPEDAWMDRVVERAGAAGTPLDRQQLGRLMGDLEEAVVDKLRRGYRVNLGPVMLHSDGTVEAMRLEA